MHPVTPTTPLQHRNSHSSEAEDCIPPELYALAYAHFPDASGRDVNSAWERSGGTGGGAAPGAPFYANSQRSQAVLRILADPTSSNTPKASSSTLRAANPSSDLRTPRPLPSVPSLPLLLDPAFPFHPAPFPRNTGKGLALPPDFRAAREASGSPTAFRTPEKRDKGKGRAVQTLVLSSDDDSDIEVIDTPRPSTRQTPRAATSKPTRSSRRSSPSSRGRLPAESPEDVALGTILQFLPDALPSHVVELLREPEYERSLQLIVEKMLSEGYPRVPEGGVAGGGVERGSVDWLDTESRLMGDERYRSAALERLMLDFRFVKSGKIDIAFETQGFFYAPTFLWLQDAVAKDRVGALRTFERSAKGREVLAESLELLEEIAWLEQQRIVGELAANRAKREVSEEPVVAEPAEVLIECGCCFGDVSFVSMDAHVFCKECAAANAAEQLALRKFKLPCLEQDCEAEFTPRESVKFLSESNLARLQKIKQEVEVDLAALVGLEKCPFCPYAYIIDDPHERLFHCVRCENITCRGCKKAPHNLITCEEVEFNEKNASSIHSIDEAMSDALIRICPHPTCTTTFIKTEGCNHITCTCGTHSCYVCRQVISATNFMNHFGETKCPLFEDGPTRAHHETEAARQAAVNAIATANPHLTQSDLANLATASSSRALFPGPPRNQGGIAERLAALNINIVQGQQRRRGLPVLPARVYSEEEMEWMVQLEGLIEY